MNSKARNSLVALLDDFESFGLDRAVAYSVGYRRVSLSYRELARLARKYADTLRFCGICRGDKVLLWAANSGDWVAAFWACQLVGAVAVPMDDGASADLAARVARDAGVKLIVASRSKLASGPLECAIPTLPLEDLADSGREDLANAGTVPRGTSSGPAYGSTEDPASPPLGRGDIAEILFTSGTTAEPRGVVLTHGNFLANLEPIERGIQPYLKYERWMHPLRFVSLVPLSHVFGQFMALFVPPLLGATVLFENSANPVDILRTIKRERATLLIAVPRMLDLVRAALEREIDARGWRAWFKKNYAAAEGQPFLKRAWRFRRIHRLLGVRFLAFISGGAALGSEAELFLKRLGFAVVQGYGMTETASLISLNHPFTATEGSVGRILPGREFKLADDGEILVRGENVSTGYWERGALRQTLQDDDGWLSTGDVGELDANGNLKFRGRKKNVIVTSAGLNIYPEDLESVLKKQPAIRDAVVIPIEIDGNAELCAALLMTNNDEAQKIERVAAIVAAGNRLLAEFQRIRKWFVWPELDFPRTPTGKPLLAAISHQANSLFSGKNGVHEGLKPDAGDLLGRLLASDTPLSSLSSLDRVELLSAIEQRYRVELNETNFSEAQTAAELQTLIQKSASRSESAAESPSAGYHYPRWAQREPVRWFRLLVYYTLVWPATQILGHPRIVGRQHLEKLSGPVIMISNHVTRRADIGLILSALPMRFRHRLAIAMGGESLVRMRKPPREWFSGKRRAYQLGYWLVTALFNVFPLPQFSGVRQSFRFAGESADRGYSVLIFPEGQVNNSDDGRMAPFQSGIGLLAENLSLPIVPVRLDGVWQMKRERRRLARRGEITAHIGVPVTFAAATAPEEIARQLQSMVESL